jgi:hypothetical protein
MSISPLGYGRLSLQGLFLDLDEATSSEAQRKYKETKHGQDDPRAKKILLLLNGRSCRVILL